MRHWQKFWHLVQRWAFLRSNPAGEENNGNINGVEVVVLALCLRFPLNSNKCSGQPKSMHWFVKNWGCPADLLTNQMVLDPKVHCHTSRAPQIGIEPTSLLMKVVALPTKPQIPQNTARYSTNLWILIQYGYFNFCSFSFTWRFHYLLNNSASQIFALFWSMALPLSFVPFSLMY